MIKPKVLSIEILMKRFELIKGPLVRINDPGLYNWFLCHRNLPCHFTCTAHDIDHAELELRKLLEDSIKYGRATYLVLENRVIQTLGYDKKQALFYTKDERGNLVYENPKSINS